MTDTLNIETNALELSDFISGIARKQLPFALSKTLNGLAYDVRDKEQDNLDQYFTIRSNWLHKKGAMPVVRSHKNQFPDMHAVLAVRDEVAAMNVTGGTKKAGSHDMAVPIEGVTRPFLNPGKETLTKKTWPSRIVKKPTRTRRTGRNKKPKPFWGETKSGHKAVFIRKGKERSLLRTLYMLKSSVSIQKGKWPLIDNVADYVDANYTKRLSRELDKAMRGRKFKR